MALTFKKTYRFIIRVLLVLSLLFGVLAFIFYLKVRIPYPEINEQVSFDSLQRTEISKDFYKLNNNWLKKNKFGVWEMYIEGDAFERGVVYGKLAKELIEKQEIHFVKQIDEIIPNSFYLFFLKMFVAWFNQDLHEYIPEEYKEEIFGISLSFSDQYDYIGPKYYRILNYHAAHDIGHALNDFNLVGCSSFAVNKEFSKDSALLIARNFDFYMGDGFAEDKLLVFVNPDKGFKYASYAWAGFTGVVSGMNEKGLTVTINAAKSELPTVAKVPISILAREILQYAKNIGEAIAIAKKRETFVSESLLIGSAEDDKAVIIEKSTKDIAIFESNKNITECTNHYQSDFFLKDSFNIENIHLSDSKYRFDRLQELLGNRTPLDVNHAVEILRNQKGLDDKDLGYGNPKAINQLIAHHGIVFKPEQKKMWISSSPYQLGEFVCYDLNDAFTSNKNSFSIDSLNVEEDPFLNSEAYKKYENYKKVKEQISKFVILGIPFSMTQNDVDTFVQNNPKNYITYMLLGDYFYELGDFEKAKKYYEESLNYEVASLQEEQKILTQLKNCEQ